MELLIPGEFCPFSKEVRTLLTSSLWTDGNLEQQEAYQNCLNILSLPPKYTTVRINTLSPEASSAVDLILDHIDQLYKDKEDLKPKVFRHPHISDLVIIESLRNLNVTPVSPSLIVERRCGTAVLRGAHIYAPGVCGGMVGLQKGDKVAVYADVEEKCLRGTKVFAGLKMFVGNGQVEMIRKEIFSCSNPSGLAIRMTEPLIECPSLGEYKTNLLFLQNLPSTVCSHVVDPKPGDYVLDMCAAPGGKTTHLATLMGNTGIVIALDRSKGKVEQIMLSVARFDLKNVKAFVYDSTKLIAENSGITETEFEGTDDIRQDGKDIQEKSKRHFLMDDISSTIENGPPYLPGIFDRILLDAPCSALGQRPQIANWVTVRELKSFPVIQRKLLHNAVHLLKPGGYLVYSTCTIVPEENEGMVAWVLDQFSFMELIEASPSWTLPGLKNSGLNHEQCKLVLRFGQSGEGEILDCDEDTIGFFIAKFRRNW